MPPAKRADPLDRKTLRQALRDWNNTQKLGRQPLARLAIVEARRRAAGYGQTPAGFGVALRDVLHDALQKLKPESGEPDWQEKRWRPYFILSQQYLDGRQPAYLIEQLNVARSTYDHEQVRALEMLADVLRQWEQLGPHPAAPAAPAGGPRALFLAPPRPNYPLVGRADCLAQLQRHLRQAPIVPLALTGLPGVGKTALAVELAHAEESLELFAEGVLWTSLGRQPDLLARLGAWGISLGLGAEELARLTRLEDRARAVQAAIGLRRMLIVIDDVWQIEDALTFKLGGPHCAYVLTTRLLRVATDFAGENTLAVHELNETDALALLTHFASAALAAEPPEAQNLAQAVGGLPLALTLMGRYLQQEARGGQPRRLHAALERLHQAGERLHLGQPQSPLEQPAAPPLSLLTALAVSDAALDPAARQALRALAVLPPKPNSFSEAAALEISAAAPAGLDTLVDYGLLENSGPGRYTLHQTVAEYARLQLAAEAPSERLAAFFTRYVEAHAQDYGALEPEANNILAALQAAYLCRKPALLIRGANAIYPYLASRGQYDLAETHLQRAEQAARAINDTVSLTTTLSNLGNSAQRRSEYAQAEARYQEGLALARKIGERENISGILQGLGVVAFSQGDYAQAELYYREGLALARAIDLHATISALLANLGALLFNRGDYAGAEAHFQEGLALARALDHRPRIQALLANLGVVAARRRDYAGAEACFGESLRLARAAGDRENIGFLLANLGTLANDRQDYAQAEAHFQEGLVLARQLGNRVRLSHLLSNLGGLATHQKDFARARLYLEEGLAIARPTGHRENIALLLNNLGSLTQKEGAFARAEAYFRESLSLAREMGHRRYMVLILNQLGEVLLAQAQAEAAQAAYVEARALAVTLDLAEAVAAADYGLAQTYLALGRPAEAEAQARQSLALFDDLHHPAAETVRQWLAERG